MTSSSTTVVSTWVRTWSLAITALLATVALAMSVLTWLGAESAGPAARIRELENAVQAQGLRMDASDATIRSMNYQLGIIARVVCIGVERGTRGTTGDAILIEDCRAITGTKRP